MEEEESPRDFRRPDSATPQLEERGAGGRNSSSLPTSWCRILGIWGLPSIPFLRVFPAR
ncbi:hypothetical protein SAMD00023353_0401510 [Rosellinia necatrix]|uniref:Uncharacterized protein n=1 Tax=Rosellinia necatrix TaxID=77044 RepID=A0A1S8A5W4_ROSNE|nr:hypothetical protein SAMD00023353_0401510 [Rosellinia necatrix]